jgi:hypothetical protein
VGKRCNARRVNDDGWMRKAGRKGETDEAKREMRPNKRKRGGRSFLVIVRSQARSVGSVGLTTTVPGWMLFGVGRWTLDVGKMESGKRRRNEAGDVEKSERTADDIWGAC